MSFNVRNNKILFVLCVSLIAGICFLLFKNNQMYNKALKIHDEVITIDTHCDIDLKNFTEDNNLSLIHISEPTRRS